MVRRSFVRDAPYPACVHRYDAWSRDGAVAERSDGQRWRIGVAEGSRRILVLETGKVGAMCSVQHLSGRNGQCGCGLSCEASDE